jgi:hypothetical protein
VDGADGVANVFVVEIPDVPAGPAAGHSDP